MNNYRALINTLALPGVIITLLALPSCKKEEVEKPAGTSTFSPVNFQQLAPGQKTYYRGYSSSCDNVDDDFMWTDDVLVLEVVKENDTLFFKEYYTSDSPSSQWGYEGKCPCLLYTSPSPRDGATSRMPSSA